MDANLTTADLDVLSWLLPDEKPFYRETKQQVLQHQVVDRKLSGEIVLGSFDESFSETVAVGEVQTEQSVFPVSITTSDHTGFSLNFPTSPIVKRLWTLSLWNPGELSPQGNPIREIRLIRQEKRTDQDGYLLALSPSERVLWLHHLMSGYNQLLPVTGIFVELARLKGKAQTGRVSHEAFFGMAERADDRELTQALLNYNKRAKKFDTEEITAVEEKRRGIRGFIDRIRR